MNGLKLETQLEQIPGISPHFLKYLQKLGLTTARDLLFHFPFRYEDFSEIYKIADLEPGQQATVQGIVKEIETRRSWRKHMTITEALIEDDSGSIHALWFNQPYVKNALRPERLVNFSGKVAFSEDLYLSNPTYEVLPSGKFRETRHTGRLVPIYPETRGLTSRGLRFLIQPILKNLERLPEWIPYGVLKSCGLTEVNSAINKVHFPEKIAEAEEAKRRFAFEELFLLQLFNFSQKLKLREEKAPAIKTDIPRLKKIIDELPFRLTTSQKKSLWEIIQDMEKPRPMNRLLQGDVGSGKTVVAVLAAIITAQNDLQTAFMAPTEVLARQHFETLRKLFKHICLKNQPVVGLVAAGSAKVLYENDLESNIKKQAFARKIRSGEIKIAIGTHALIQKTVSFKNLGLVIVDEQHRFGVQQRATLARRQTPTKTQTDSENELLYEKIIFQIRRCLFEVKKQLGLGHKESIYQKALEEEFKKSKIDFEKGKTVPVIYNNKRVGIYRPDFVINNAIILELKALPFVGGIERKQLWNYLRGSEYQLALLANFGPEKLTIERVIYQKARGSQRLSASSPQLSALVPHFLSMSATPIPRTLMLTIFGDLDISTITELPAGRKNIVTKIVAPQNRPATYQFIREQIRKGRQAFVICPRIEPSADERGTDADLRGSSLESPRQSALSQRKSALPWETKAVKEEYEKLSKKIFPDLEVEMLHGQMPASPKLQRGEPASPKARRSLASAEKLNKEGVMRKFRDGEIDILVATSVVEVGVDVPNATIMMIEGTERFGLAQLYQFRGRVGRGEHQSFCLLFTDSDSRAAHDRLQAILKAKNGFELAEKDLKLRGPGEFLGQKQTGLPDIAMNGLQNPELIKLSREAAAKVLNEDRTLEKYPALKSKLSAFRQKIHPE